MRVTICHMLDNSSFTLGNKQRHVYNEFPLQGLPCLGAADGPCSGSVNASLRLCACTMVNRPRAFWGNLFVTTRGEWQGQWKNTGHVFQLNPCDATERGVSCPLFSCPLPKQKHEWKGKWAGLFIHSCFFFFCDLLFSISILSLEQSVWSKCTSK